MANKKIQAQPYVYDRQGIPGAQQMIMQPGSGYPQYPTYPPPGQFGPSQPGFQVPPMPAQQGLTQNIPGMLPLEESYIENILRLNRGKIATVYMTFENNREWNAQIFKGIIEAAGRDHLILSDPQTGMRYLLLMVYLDYITFDGEINYDIQNTLASYPPR
ncbi:spore coat protein GerQ [Metabacillus rhizolycopersici]|uniref:Spore coat protein GerQ n=1 Tax=Metabacillus rhizolycopersici TaxID=2875709 RepID=A0ABS7UZF6_9BACI|nr:spore coat protein GerQ [Metabacillus rhizolycopersici]MBZ5753706.1 spore coat protein GerQ [Metabacillus rhizolycopersici]